MNATTMDFPLSLNHLIDRAGKYYAKGEVVSRMADKSLKRHTYAQIRARARALAHGLHLAGLKAGERVATLMWNHHAHLEAYFGIPMAGGIYHTLNLRLGPEELAFIVNHAQDRFLIVDDVLLPLLQKVIGQVKLERIFVVSLTGKPVPTPFESYEGLLSDPGEDWVTPAVDERQGAGLCYTSGTTGKPKGVCYSHRALVLHTFASALPDTLGISASDVVVPVVPMFHANAWGLPFTATMVGATQVMPGPFLDAESLLELYVKEKVTISAGVPTIWLGVLQLLDAAPGKYPLQPGLRMVVGGAAAPQSMIRGFDKHGLRVVHAWGMTETAPLGTVANLKPSLRGLPEDEQYAYRAKQGIPAPYVELRAMGDKGPVPWDGVSLGELHVRGCWVAGSYHDYPGRDSWTEDGWFRTGDVVAIDAEGYVRIADRAKDLIKSGGEWISSQEMENALMAHPAVREAAVFGIPHEKWGERPLAVVVFKDGKKASDDELRAHLGKSFAKWALPDGFVARAEIPRGTTGKFLKSKLREELSAWKPS